MPIAKETLRIGFTVVATEGAYVSQAAVDEYGWGDKVEKSAEPVADEVDTRDDAAPSPNRRTRTK